MRTKKRNKKQTGCPVCFLREVSEIVGLAFLRPLRERTQAAGRDENGFHLASCGVNQPLLLKIRQLALLRLHVRVADVVTGKRLFSGDDAFA